MVKNGYSVCEFFVFGFLIVFFCFDGSFFERVVIVMVYYDEDGVMGFIVNKFFFIDLGSLFQIVDDVFFG